MGCQSTHEDTHLRGIPSASEELAYLSGDVFDLWEEMCEHETQVFGDQYYSIHAEHLCWSGKILQLTPSGFRCYDSKWTETGKSAGRIIHNGNYDLLIVLTKTIEV